MLGRSGDAAGVAEAEVGAVAEGAALARGALLAAGSPLPSAKLPGSTKVGAPGSVEKRAEEQAGTKTSGAVAKTRAARIED